MKNYPLTASEPTSCKSTRSTISGLAHNVAFINATWFWFTICAPGFPVPVTLWTWDLFLWGRSKQICKLCNKPQAVEIMLQKIIFKSSKKEGNTIIFTLAINAGDLIPISQNLEVPSPQMMEKIDLRGKNSFRFSMFRTKIYKCWDNTDVLSSQIDKCKMPSGTGARTPIHLCV